FKKFVSNKYYDCEVSFLQSMDGDSGPHDCTRCRMGCAICHRAGDRIQQLQFSDSSDMDKVLPQETMGSGNWQRVSGQFIGVNASIMSCSCDKSRDGMSPSAHLADGCMDLILIHHCDHVQYLRYLHRVSSTANQ
ncbi:ceramide kinase-like, partial [Saccoglossus kowalevskii]